MSPAAKRCLASLRAAADDLEDQLMLDEADAEAVKTELANCVAEANRLRRRLHQLEQSASGANPLKQPVDPQPRPDADDKS